ncbi:hypothetical protein DFJ74DRAFT_763897 [Hyaloraphidium curvatum]|nr:hypothetical protein DFJ74DRAFT_763897 [Hyaloraphidium curvatum]
MLTAVEPGGAAEFVDKRSDAERDAMLLAVFRFFFIRDMLAADAFPLAVPSDGSAGPRTAFRLAGASFPFFRRVRVSGTVVDRIEDETTLTATVDDMTATIRVRVSKADVHRKKLAEVTKGALVTFLGDLVCDESGKRWVESNILDVKQDALFTIMFPMQTLQMYTEQYFPDRFPEQAQRYTQRISQLQSQKGSQMPVGPEEEADFKAAMEELGEATDLVPAPEAPEAAENAKGGDFEFDDDLDEGNLMLVDFDAAVANAAAPSVPAAAPQPGLPVAPNAGKPANTGDSPSFSQYEINDMDDALFMDVVVDVPMPNAAQGERSTEVMAAIRTYLSSAGGLKSLDEIRSQCTAQYKEEEVQDALTKLVDGFEAYSRDGKFALM